MIKSTASRSRSIPVEPAGCPTLTKAPFVYDHGDTAKYTPLLPMHSLGHAFVPAPFHAGGLRYHGMAPTVSQLVDEGILTPKSVKQRQVFEAGILLARTEGIIPAPETNHALAQVIEEAKKAKEEGKEKVILFNWSGHGLLDLTAYESYFAGNIKDIELSDAEMAEAMKVFAGHPNPQHLKTVK
jgi:tryptophan synthase beta chain